MAVPCIFEQNNTMKKNLTLLTALAFAWNAHAQPTLTFATNAPVPGTQYTLHYGPYVAPGNAGDMQTWDLSALASDSTDVLQLVAPSSTPNGAQFPNATVAELSSEVTTYYQVNANGIHFAGSDDGVSLIVNQTVPNYLAFPCTMGSNWSTPHAATFTFDGENVHRSGEVSGEADGYGTLTMPWGTVNDVLRIHLVNTVQDSLSLFTIDYTYDSYLYYVAGQPFPIAELVSATVDFGFGQPELVQFSRWTSDVSTGLADAPALWNDLHVYPNPASDLLNISLPSGSGTKVMASVNDAAGRTVLQAQLNAGGAVARLEVQHLSPGMYQLMLTDERGLRSATRFQVR